MGLNDLNRIVDTILLWNTSSYSTSDQLITQYLIDYSRYERYGNIAYLLLLNYEHISSIDERINNVMIKPAPPDFLLLLGFFLATVQSP